MVSSTALTRNAVQMMGVAILGTAAFLVVRYESLPWLLPVHFKPNGIANGWQYKTLARVLLPVFVQLALAATLGGIGALLLSRGDGRQPPDRPDANAAATAAEAVSLIALIWVAFQAYAAVAIVRMWTTERAGLGWDYVLLEVIGLVLTAVAGVRAHVRLGRPEPRPYVPEHWRLGQLYRNADDPALFVPARNGLRWTLNFGRPAAVALLGLILVIGVAGPTVILVLALR